jgi:2-phospho-L-lactate/phosphoenolpyruvate guanylyltransferase
MSVERMPDVPVWTIVIPFKGGPSAKSRLSHGVEGAAGFRPDVRHRLALAFLCDTVAAAQAVHQVADIVIVSSDPALLTAMDGITLVADPGRGLNAAAASGINWARSLDPDRPAAVLAGDLPCLQTRDLAAALALAARHRLALVPDRRGTGTTMISAQPGVPVTPLFGEQSRDAHLRAGHVLLPIPDGSTLRADVDTPEDLDQALRRGTGAHTRSAVLRPPPRAYGRLAGRKQPLPAAV